MPTKRTKAKPRKARTAIVKPPGAVEDKQFKSSVGTQAHVVRVLQEGAKILADDNIAPVTSPKCSICLSKYRALIEQDIVMSVSPSQIVKKFKESHNINLSIDQIRNHRQNHFPYEKAAIHSFLASEEQLYENYQTGKAAVVDNLTLLGVIQQAGLANVIKHPEKVYAKDAIAAAEAAHRMTEGQKFQIQVDGFVNEVQEQMKDVMAAVTEILTEDQKIAFAEKMQSLKASRTEL